MLKIAYGSFILIERQPVKIYKFGLVELKACADLSDLAILLEVKPKFLAKQIYHTPDRSKYKTFSIHKKDGSLREINAPSNKLKFVQARLSRLLYQCYFDIHGKPANPSHILSHGFQRGRGLSIFTNGARHTNRRYVFNIDIESFFDAFNFGRVRGFFAKNKHFSLEDYAATTIA